MLFNMCACCRHTRGRFERTHGGQRGVIVSSAYQNLPKLGHQKAPEVHQRNPWILPISSLRIGREQHVAESSNHSLCLEKLFSFSNPEGHWESPLSLPPPQQPQQPATATATARKNKDKDKDTHTHMYLYMYMCKYMCMCVCV